MRENLNVIAAYVIMLGLIILVGFLQSWSIALSILCFCLISAVMTMGANIQWGYAGLINFGIMGYTALGGLAAVLVSVPPVREAGQVVALSMLLCLFVIVLIVQKKDHRRVFGKLYKYFAEITKPIFTEHLDLGSHNFALDQLGLCSSKDPMPKQSNLFN